MTASRQEFTSHDAWHIATAHPAARLTSAVLTESRLVEGEVVAAWDHATRRGWALLAEAASIDYRADPAWRGIAETAELVLEAGLKRVFHDAKVDAYNANTRDAPMGVHASIILPATPGQRTWMRDDSVEINVYYENVGGKAKISGPDAPVHIDVFMYGEKRLGAQHPRGGDVVFLWSGKADNLVEGAKAVVAALTKEKARVDTLHASWAPAK